MERQQQPPPETFDFKIKFAETKAHAKVRGVDRPESGKCWGIQTGCGYRLIWRGVLDFTWLEGGDALHGGLEDSSLGLVPEAGGLVE